MTNQDPHASAPAPWVFTYTPVSDICDAASITMPDPTAIAQGAACHLPAQSGLTTGWDIRCAPFPQPHLPPDRVYAVQTPNMYASHANGPYPPALTPPYESPQTSELKCPATTHVPTMVVNNTALPTDWYASKVTIYKSQNPPPLAPVPAISTSMPTYPNVLPAVFPIIGQAR